MFFVVAVTAPLQALMNENFLGLFVSMCLKAGVLLLLACRVEKRLKNLSECLLALAFLVTFLAMQKSNAWGVGHADAPLNSLNKRLGRY